ncbi:MAG: hypothetical protein J0H82_05930 [Alphaproteobacteria bacterium]|jgi:hypothetical protein|nr:hypothetical protein [Alphaproteobacteria bacterium]
MAEPTPEAILNGGWRTPPDHYNYGPRGHGYGWTSTGFPRVYQLHRPSADGRARDCVFLVDGKEVADLSAAVTALATPPVLGPDETIAWNVVPVEFRGLREVEAEVAAALGGDKSRRLHAIHFLKRKGLIEIGREDLPAEEIARRPEILRHLAFRPTCRRRPGANFTIALETANG